MNWVSTIARVCIEPHRRSSDSLSVVGNKRVIAFYEPDNDHCALNAVVYDKTDADTGMTTAARFRVSLIDARWCISTAGRMALGFGLIRPHEPILTTNLWD